MDANEYIQKKYDLDLTKKSPIIIRGSRHIDLVQLFAELQFKVGAEIGVDRGRYSEVICQANPGVKLFCIDPWIVYGGYIEMRLQDRLNKNKQATIRRLKPYGCEIQQAFSIDAVKQIEDGSLDFVFIDGNHVYEYVVEDIAEWSKKVRSGGIVSGHDYMQSRDPIKSPCHVIKAIDGYTTSYEINPWFVLSNDRCPSWMWVKS
jgi:hypothetical protein